jgi:hypothetical protein
MLDLKGTEIHGTTAYCCSAVFITTLRLHSNLNTASKLLKPAIFDNFITKTRNLTNTIGTKL